MLKSVLLVDKDRFAAKVRQRASAVEPRSFIFVHGYNVSFEDAALRTAQLSEDLDRQAVPVFYSWPSRANPALYPIDSETASWTRANMQTFFEFYADHAPGQIIVIAHGVTTQ